ncbi:MAG: S8 family serine peptidase [Phycisphaerae bacterium]|nr:S8 family serine peptidase [Phycisphaerae bacterium]
MLTKRLGIIPWAILVCPNVIVHIPAQAEPPGPGDRESAYFYDATGRCAVTASQSEFLVCVEAKSGVDVSVRPSSLSPRVIPTDLPDAAMRLEDALERRGMHVARGARAADLAGLQDVAFALPLLYRDGSGVPIYMTDEIILAVRPGVSDRQLSDIARLHGCDVRACKWGTGRYLLKVRDTRVTNPLAVANALHEQPALFQYAHPDFFLPKVTQSPPVVEDPFYLSLQWHLDGDDSKGAVSGSDINAEAAWDSDHGPDAEGIPAVRVSILDECVEKLHPDLFPNYAAGIDLDYDPPDDDPSPDASQRHGTSCAGVAVAAGNTIGVRGAAPNCGLIGVKFFGATVSEMADGFYFSVDPNDDGDHSDGAAVMSNSWSFADGTLLPPDVVNAINHAAINGRNGLGCLVLFAAANDDHTINGVTALAQLDTTMAIGGTNSNRMHTEFSDVGPELSVAAPTNDRGDDGVRFSWLDITTVDNTGSSGYNGIPSDLDYTNQFGGTSSATPLAAGVLALIISQDPTMTAAQARAILYHTAVPIEEPYGRFDGITGHSHRLGFGKVDAGAAVAAADAGLRWPDRPETLSATAVVNDIQLAWDTPDDDYAGSLLVRSDTPFAWMPTDGEVYSVSQIVVPGVEVAYNDVGNTFLDVGAASGGFFYAVYPRSASNLYGFGAKAHLIRGSTVVFQDNSEGTDPGWTHGGILDEWARGTPTSAVSPFGQSVGGSGPLAGLRGTRAINGNHCWGTDLLATYDPGTDSYLQTPLLNLTGVTAPVFLEYYDWCLLETYYDTCSVEIVDVDDTLLGVVDPDTGGDYDWTQQVYDISAFAGQPIKVRFHIASDGLFQRDGWFIDEVRIIAATTDPLPPTANDLYVETGEDTPVYVMLEGSDPNPGDTLQYVIGSLPAHGQLVDPNGGTIGSAPYTLLSNGSIVQYNPTTGYQGPDGFDYQTYDGGLYSNVATVTLSVGTPVPAYEFAMDTDPGWTTDGDWAFGQPQGLGGDPTGAFTGVNVYGYNLAGKYPDDLPAKYLTMLPINCTGLSRVTLSFARWLGVEAGSYDKATIEVSIDGANWATVWSHMGDDLQETSWSQQSYNLSAVADDEPFVLIRWGMGPTDGSTTFSGWNIDDVSVAAIGTPAVNQPPYARDVAVSTAINQGVDITLDAVDGNSDPLDYTILSLPTDGTLSDPNAGVIASTPYALLSGGQIVHYDPPGDAGLDGFDYEVDDGLLTSNVGVVSIEIIEPAPFPLAEDFEAGPPLAVYWSTHSTNTGRILVTGDNEPIGAYHLTMDSTADSSYSLNEVTLAVDLEGNSQVILQYDWKGFGEESHALPASWTGSAEGDGVAVSVDGETWYRIANLFDPGKSGGDREDGGDGERGEARADTYQTVKLDLDAAVAAVGLTYTSTFRIRFQQYDNYPIPSDGIAIDNVQLIQGTDDPLIASDNLPPGRVDEPYGPVALSVIGGDPPYGWSVLDIYEETDLGSSQFAMVGTAQEVSGDDTVVDYVMPFAFPFYGESLTDVKIAVDGWINFGAYVGSTWNNSEVLLAWNKRIAVLWDDLRIDTGVGDIFIDEGTPGQVTIRWDAVVDSSGNPCNFSAMLFDDGRIQFHYGSGNTTLTPTVGISSGDGERYVLSSYDGAATLTDANSLEMEYLVLPPGIELSGDGVLSGEPTKAGVYMPTFHIEDASERTDTKQIEFVVTDELFGDFDGDSNVDEDDFEMFKVCYTGQDGGPVAPECEPGDSNGDNDVDCQDWLAFEQAFQDSSGYPPARLLEIEEFIAVLLDPEQDEVLQCIADVNHDGSNDGLDIQLYTDALLTP